jgi:hypothetical protein
MGWASGSELMDAVVASAKRHFRDKAALPRIDGLPQKSLGCLKTQLPTG